jgi:hypothetical protein
MYPGRGTLQRMKDAYSFTPEGLERIALAGLAPAVVWSALRSGRRLVRFVSDNRAAVFGVADGGQYVAVAVVESRADDNDWDIVGARLMDRDEIVTFNRNTRRQS